MSPGKDFDEASSLRERLADLEAELQHQIRLRQASEATFYQLADTTPLMIWMSGPDAMFTYFNRAWLEFRGRELTEESGNGWAEGLHPDDRAFCIETYMRAFTAREAFRIQYRLKRASGDYRWLEDTGVPRFEGDGSFAGFMGTAVDINDRKCGIFTPDEDSVKMVFALTERERQVLVLIADGKSTKEAAVRLGISYKTADSHRSRILEKLGVHETASMVRYAIRAGLITP
ncbi:MAG TPA: LuxR C-terminal-related transcriptional regulator [Bryobacteraceae bacterium]|nr:LuxR C-terminal-related transcriptional regulator [Bryobacteraceae bacterium]